MHGKWEPAEDLFILALRLGTNLTWRGIEEEFCKNFPPATAKDLESRYNKNLRRDHDPQGRRKLDIIDDWRHYGRVEAGEDGVIQEVLAILARYPDKRLW
ncbi:hypothetical protein AJ80_03125 [Polytolypa hystricis UAMH7299]|uniref:Myb-like domain-containing protein n=1 Tax=Polytolypa hystricis (strain UAMH7299) TaxID=1447883 RepID=A0A2B7YJR9_POLH7|nr:hypothetical protein AJ80_03125 [Polytolypa hystricis UAMH7299]